MSVCAGKVKCEIYRQKKYCRKSTAADDSHECVNCRHAKRQCDVEYCGLDIAGVCQVRWIKWLNT